MTDAVEPCSDAELEMLYEAARAELAQGAAGASFRWVLARTRKVGRYTVLPVSVARHRGVDRLPAFSDLLPYEVGALRSMVAAVQHGRLGANLTIVAVDPKKTYDPIYFEQVMIFADYMETTTFRQAKDGSVVVMGTPKPFHPHLVDKDALVLAGVILDDVRARGIDPMTGIAFDAVDET